MATLCVSCFLKLQNGQLTLYLRKNIYKSGLSTLLFVDFLQYVTRTCDKFMMFSQLRDTSGSPSCQHRSQDSSPSHPLSRKREVTSWVESAHQKSQHSPWSLHPTSFARSRIQRRRHPWETHRPCWYLPVRLHANRRQKSRRWPNMLYRSGNLEDLIWQSLCPWLWLAVRGNERAGVVVLWDVTKK